MGEGAATVGSGVGVIATAAVGLGAFSTGKAWGAMIVSVVVVGVGEAPMTV